MKFWLLVALAIATVPVVPASAHMSRDCLRMIVQFSAFTSSAVTEAALLIEREKQAGRRVSAAELKKIKDNVNRRYGLQKMVNETFRNCLETR